MNFKKSIAFAIAICAVFMFTGIASAANHVNLKTTVPNIAKSDCDQAGTITMEFDSGTQMEEGDIIQFTLNNDVKVCKEIDFFLAIADNDISLISDDTADPFTTNDAGNPDLLNVTGFGVGGSGAPVAMSALGAGLLTIDGFPAVIGFKVYSPVGSQVVTMTLGYIDSNDSYKFKTRPGTGPAVNFLVSYAPTNAPTIMSIKLFDEKDNANYFYKDDPATATVKDYKKSILLEDNVICINTTGFNYEYVGATPDSIVATNSYKLGFSGDYTIAHVVAADSYVVQNVCKDACPTVSIASSTDQFGFVSTPPGVFDTGDYATFPPIGAGGPDRWNSFNTCDTSLGNGVILRKVGAPLVPNQKFTVKLELLIDGIAADQSVVWWDAANTGSALYETKSSNAGRCSSAGTPMTAGTINSMVRATNKTVVNAEITAGLDHDSFVLDLPQVHYDYKKLVAGAKAEVRVTFGKFPCGGTTSGTLCLATFVSECPAPAFATSLLYPFATGSANPTFWSGIVVTNTSSKAAKATITLYDVKGGSGHIAVSIDPRGQYTKTIGDIVSAAAFVEGAKALDAASDLQIAVTADTTVDGILFVGAEGVMHGYLPRR